MEKTRLPKCVTFGELVGGAGCVGGGAGKRVDGVFPGRPQAFGINADQWITRTKGASMEDTILPKCVIFREQVGGAGCVGGQEKEWMECFLEHLRAFGINIDQWTTAAQNEGKWRRNKGRNVSWRSGSWQRKPGLDYGMH